MAAISGPTPIVKITPRYPQEALNQNFSGVVKMEFTVDDNGKPINIQASSNANEILINESVHTLKKNRYHPKYSGEKVVVEGVFHLTSKITGH